MRKILLVNALPLVILGVTLLFLNDFQNSLLETEVSALREQAHIYAAALGQSAVFRRPDDRLYGRVALDPLLARPLLIRLTEPSPLVEARLYGSDGRIIATSRGAFTCMRGMSHGSCHMEFRAQKAGAAATVKDLDAADQKFNPVARFYNWLLSLLPLTSRPGIVAFDGGSSPSSLPEMGGRPDDDAPPYIRRTATQKLIITVAKPVMREGETIGILQLTKAAPEVDRSLFAVRSSILSLFLAALVVTVLLSWYLSLTIARPLLRLTVASDHLGKNPGRIDDIAERLLNRRDEIGILARSLRERSTALWARMDAIERFAADVSHELKNPLSSIHSAIETSGRVSSETQRRQLLDIVENDVRRLDRLITDISVASRLDAELSRVHPAAVNIGRILQALCEMHEATRKEGGPFLVFTPLGGDAVYAVAVEDRLVQVLRNLISNAESFSPPCSKIVLTCTTQGQSVCVTVDDEGPGIPPLKMEEIFDRFYSERPASEIFGQHSGLGLSISRQIIEATGGQLTAENRLDSEGRIIGARFVILIRRAVNKVEPMALDPRPV